MTGLYDWFDKDENMFAVLTVMVAFCLISTLAVSTYMINFAVMNDYVIVPIQNLSEELEADDIIIDGQSDLTQEMGEFFQTIPFYLDPLWFGIYLLFIINTFIFAYRARPQNYFGFFSILFYGLMFLLFMLSLFVIFAEWWRDSILLPMLPTVLSYVPLFSFYLNNVGILTAIQIVICLFINLTDFDFSAIYTRKKKEQLSLEDNEVL